MDYLLKLKIEPIKIFKKENFSIKTNMELWKISARLI